MWDDARIIARDLGRLFVLLADLMAGSTLVAAVFGEWYAVPGFLLSAALTVVLGCGLHRWGTDPSDTDPAHGLVTAALAWLTSAALCSLPILLVAWTVALDPRWLATPELTRTLAVFRSPIDALWLAGMPAWHAINHGMTGIATGGFTVTADGIAAYDDPVIEAVLLPVMTLGGISFAVHYYALQGDVRTPYEDRQTRWLFGLLAVGSLLVATVLFAGPFPDRTDAVRFGVFQFVSALTCTGFQTDNALGVVWSTQAQLLLVAAMTIGGASGSTAGGIKVIRPISLTKGPLYRMTQAFHSEGDRAPGAVTEEGDATVDHSSSEFDQAAAVGLLWMVVLVTGVIGLLFVLDEPLAAALFEAASAQGNVGLSAGVAGPEMPAAAKGILVLDTWIGRLEIVPIAALVRVLITGFGAD